MVIWCYYMSLTCGYGAIGELIATILGMSGNRNRGVFRGVDSVAGGIAAWRWDALFEEIVASFSRHSLPAWAEIQSMVTIDTRPLRVLVTKIGLDGHDRGSRIVAAYLRDAGMEVIYTPPWQTISGIVKLATEEDVDVIGISSLATDHLIVPKMIDALREAGLDHVSVVVGGIVPDEEKDALLAAGVSRIFGPGSARDEIVGFVTSAARQSRLDRIDEFSEGDQ